MDILDTFNEEVRRAATALAYDATIEDPLLRAAGQLYLEFDLCFPFDGYDRREPHPHFSNGAPRFAVYVRPR